jgi:hypothetical protein
MKKFNYLLLLLAVVMLFAASCGKDGAVGPQGSTGPTGPQGAIGPAGPAGPNGQNGSIIYSGAGAPAAATGTTGDFYLETSNGQLFGPKSASGWGTGFSLVGPAGATGQTGATGAAGSQTLSGTGTPAATLGATGDYYLDKASYLLYGPKLTTGWGTAVSLRGPAGVAGTANVQYSGWNYATNLRDSIIDGSNEGIMNLTSTSLTQSILDNGTVMVYLTFGAGVFPMPYTSGAGGKTSTVSFIPQVGRMLITRYTADNSNSVPLSTLLQYRYILIPGGVSIAALHHVNLNDYEAVKRFYRIPD